MNSKYPLLDACDPTSCMSAKIMLCDRIIANIFRKHLSSFNLTNSQLTILLVLAKMGNLSQVELSKVLALEKSSVSRNIKRLIAAKYLEKENFRKLQITDTGKTLLESLIPAWESAKAEVNQMLGTEGQTALNTIVTNLTSQYKS